MGVITSVALAVCIVAALPWVRNTHHKWVNTDLSAAFSNIRSVFERHHRFMGWCVLPRSCIFRKTDARFSPGLPWLQVSMFTLMFNELTLTRLKHGYLWFLGIAIMSKLDHGVLVAISSDSKISGSCLEWLSCKSFRCVVSVGYTNYTASIMIPWFTVREVEVEVETVRLCLIGMCFDQLTEF